MLGVIDGIDLQAKLRLSSQLIDPFDVANLLPRRSHELLLLSLDHCSAERRNRAVTRIEVQFVEPVKERCGCGIDIHRVSSRLPTTVDRWTKNRIVVGAVGFRG